MIVNNFRKKTDVIVSAIQLRRVLEEAAKIEEKEGGKYIRPIVLFQAQPRTGEEQTTYDKIKEDLIALGIPPEEIKIKTGDVNELKNVDLSSTACRVRYIITVNALKEGWDCPFAYILASLANRSSAVDVEQILGRVLRQPYAVTHIAPVLNTSYVFTSSANFLDTLTKIVKGLERAGFSDKDHRDRDFGNEIESGVEPATPNDQTALPGFDILGPQEPVIALGEQEENDVVSEENLAASMEQVETRIEEIVETTIAQNQQFQEQADSISDIDFVPTEIRDRINTFRMVEGFRNRVEGVEIPQFFIKVERSGFYFTDTEVFLHNDEVLREFQLGLQSIDIQFDNLESDAWMVDLEKLSDDDYKPTYKKLRPEQRSRLNSRILELPDKSRIDAVNQRLCDLIGDLYPIDDREIRRYVSRILESMNVEQLRDCLERDIVYSTRIKQKIERITDDHKEKVFNDYVATGKVFLKPSWQLPATIMPVETAVGLTKTLYHHEQTMNPFEKRVISEIADLDSVAFWHRNIERTGFKINGFLNHFPDFFVFMNSGRILIIETKGDYLDNSDSEAKIRLGTKWASEAGKNYHYMMIFETRDVPDAFNLQEAIKRISQL